MSTSDWLFTQQAHRTNIFAPLSHLDLISFLKSNLKPISIAGQQFSSGGQTLVDDGIIVSLKRLNLISEINLLNKEYTVEAGATWKDVLNTLVPYHLVPLEMQSYSSFSIGGSISVNAHGRMSRRVSDSIIWMDIITIEGEIFRCSADLNPKLFFSVIGGYGLVAIIWRAHLKSRSNLNLICRVYSHNQSLFEDIKYFAEKKPVLYNCEISNIQRIHHIVWEAQSSELILKPASVQGDSLLGQLFSRFGENVMALIGPAHAWYQTYHPYQINGTKQLLSYEMGYNAKDLVPLTPFRLFQSLLQEYFLPLESLEKFKLELFQLVESYRVNLLNLSIRLIHSKSLSSYLDWINFEPGESGLKVAIVLYINIFNFIEAEPAYREFTQTVIQLALDLGGSWYLPYYPAFTKAQLLKAFPNLPQFIKIKKNYDPQNKLTSKFWQYCQNLNKSH